MWQQRGETSHPPSRSYSPSSHRAPFYLSGRSENEASAFDLTLRKHPVECKAGVRRAPCGMSMRYTPGIRSQVVTILGCKVTSGSYPFFFSLSWERWLAILIFQSDSGERSMTNASVCASGFGPRSHLRKGPFDEVTIYAILLVAFFFFFLKWRSARAHQLHFKS